MGPDGHRRLDVTFSRSRIGLLILALCFAGAVVKMEHFQPALDPRKQELLEMRFTGAKVGAFFWSKETLCCDQFRGHQWRRRLPGLRNGALYAYTPAGHVRSMPGCQVHPPAGQGGAVDDVALTQHPLSSPPLPLPLLGHVILHRIMQPSWGPRLARLL